MPAWIVDQTLSCCVYPTEQETQSERARILSAGLTGNILEVSFGVTKHFSSSADELSFKKKHGINAYFRGFLRDRVGCLSEPRGQESMQALC